MREVTAPDALQRCFDRFDRAGISWCLLRAIPSAAQESGDIDVLVGAGQLDAACESAESVGFIRVPGHSHGRNLLRYDAATAQWFWVHAVDEISFGPHYCLLTHAETACLSRVQGGAGFRRLHSSDEFWITLLHCLLDKARIKSQHRETLTRLIEAAHDDGPIRSVVESCAGQHTVDRLVEAVNNAHWERLEQSAPSLLERWLRYGCVRSRRSLVDRIRGAIAYRLRGWNRRGISVALVGPDGAGKTTLATEIVRGFILPARRVYMGLTGGSLAYVQRLRIPGVVITGQILVLWLRCLYAFGLRCQGYLVVFDRYVYDAAVPTPHRLNRIQRASRWMLGHVCPRPTLILVLSAPGEVMYRRKPKYGATQLEDWRQHFLRLKNRFPDLEVIDTTLPVDRVRVQVFELIWCKYAERWQSART